MENQKTSPAADVLILGAGINGCGIASELGRSGYRVTVLEKNTIGSGTSSKSSRLIHGGLRYLEQFQFALVREALLDRQELLRKYPGLVKLKPFYLPVFSDSPRPAWMIWCGLKLYDFLSSRHTGFGSRIVPRESFREIAPEFDHSRIRAVFQYYDAKTNDLDLTKQVAADAQSAGVKFHEKVKITRIKSAGSRIRVDTDRGRFDCVLLINATGPWIDEVNAAFDLPARYHIRKVSGIHLIVKGLITFDAMFMQTDRKRIFFIIPEPENDVTLVGTTERDETAPMDEITISPEDVAYLLEQTNHYLPADQAISAEDILSTYIGVRPLIAHNDNPTELSREYELDLQRLGEAPLIHVFGGKLTTYLSLARQVRKKADRCFDR